MSLTMAVLLLGKLGTLNSPSSSSAFLMLGGNLVPGLVKPVLPVCPVRPVLVAPAAALPPPNMDGNHDRSSGIMAGADAVMSARFVSIADVTKPMLYVGSRSGTRS